jgi:hypothetical protein
MRHPAGIPRANPEPKFFSPPSHEGTKGDGVTGNREPQTANAPREADPAFAREW